MAQRSTAWGAYRQIADALRTRIAAGEFSPGQPFPAESVLSIEYGVARNTVRRALSLLTEEGLLTLASGRRQLARGGENGMPEHRRIADDLSARIADGRMRPGQALPSESALSTSYGVARGTVRHALASLEGAGLVEARRGKGWFVRASRPGGDSPLA
ncbi:GntR family transcriptional regulator [Catenuloplanes atrovinosus]|uniref:DNA-binding GntR family transcriptional regulator n=1 Tax=Catenuloplanes atrovinosus TaxID=137266 RepID=A0AAE3YVH6_9ACTN|nr:winged helix-turn-helix domain-containing protein [Catenuloplanes atrovinosus]MDR7279129.1 DNA-binding GntR family transcriptional regulator [Catenuloplanes atrovinosus]